MTEVTTHTGFTLWFTGMSGAGKSTLTNALADRFREHGWRFEVLDGDEVRTHLSKGLGFSKEDRDTNVRRIGFVARLLARNGVIAVTAAISPYAEIRDEVHALHAADGVPFVEVYAEAAFETLAARDVKGLYKRAAAGEIAQFTGLSDPYEPPLHPEVVVHTDRDTVAESVQQIWDYLQHRQLISG
jgi:adenylyl-sulfate kinase